MKTTVNKLLLVGALAAFTIAGAAGCSHQAADTPPPSAVAAASTYKPAPLPVDTIAAMTEAKKVANMPPEQRAQYLKDHPNSVALPPMPKRRDEP